MKRDPKCWACLCWPVCERDAEQTYAARLASNHAWTGGQHIYGMGALRLVGSVREPVGSNSNPVKEPRQRPIPASADLERCRACRSAGKATCTQKCRATRINRAVGLSA